MELRAKIAADHANRDTLLKNLLFVSIFNIFLFASGQVYAWTGQVVSVTDGDTIKVMHDGVETKVRLYGVDTPEKKQAYGKKAKEFTASLVAGKKVDVDPIDQDRYGRTVGIVTATGQSLNKSLVKNGYAWVYQKYCHRAECKSWTSEEAQARSAKLGLWADQKPVPPWEWRRR